MAHVPEPAMAVGRRASGHADPTSIEATFEPPKDVLDLFDLVRYVERDITAAARRSYELTHKHDKRVRTEPAGAGTCLACGRWVSGAVRTNDNGDMAEDRLRAGYCDACRKDWARRKRDPNAIMYLGEWRWTRWGERERAEGREPSKSAWTAWQKEAR